MWRCRRPRDQGTQKHPGHCSPCPSSLRHGSHCRRSPLKGRRAAEASGYSCPTLCKPKRLWGFTLPGAKLSPSWSASGRWWSKTREMMHVRLVPPERHTHTRRRRKKQHSVSLQTSAHPTVHLVVEVRAYKGLAPCPRASADDLAAARDQQQPRRVSAWSCKSRCS